MRFDDLLVPEDDYPSGPCESRREWLLTYSRGVSVDVIASWCRVTPARVRRAVEKQIRHSPSWFDQCLRIHDQPADLREKFNRPTREGLWWKHYNDVAAHVSAHGMLPSQNHGDHARVLYRWIEAQRRQNDAGNLTHDKLEALDRLGSWQGVRRGRPDEHWTRRLTELCLFHRSHGRLPMYDPVRRPEERLLAVWLIRQRTWERKGRLRLDRRHRLPAALPDWMPATPTTK
ncbi:helicase associated domain-containing protein [Arthrobacter bussei]|uniref:helicase associated domain-containing protein n=1 Tax=Arthrobacter bussei TaxID=2594179 RepID=UPI0019D6551C|nr:helicase associated domain-containing protein [Arthrobacter bussei]